MALILPSGEIDVSAQSIFLTLDYSILLYILYYISASIFNLNLEENGEHYQNNLYVPSCVVV